MSFDFGASIDKAADRLFAKLNDKVYEIAKYMFTTVVRLTPSPTQRNAQYATGLLANQWYPATNGYSGGLDTAVSNSGMASLARIQSLTGTAFLRKDGMVSMTNNVHYAYRAEVLGWPLTEGQPWKGVVGPYEMVGLALDATVFKLRSALTGGGYNFNVK